MQDFDYDAPIEVREGRAPGWFWCSNALHDSIKDIGASGLAVYTVLARHANNQTQKCWPSVERIAAMSGLKKDTALSAIKRLEEFGFIHKKRGGGRGNPNKYTLLNKQSKIETVYAKQSNPVKETVQNSSQTVQNGEGNYTNNKTKELDSNELPKKTKVAYNELAKLRDPVYRKEILARSATNTAVK